MIRQLQRGATGENLLSRWTDRASRYEFHDEWVVKGTLQEVASLIFDPESIPSWWPVFRSMSLTDPGDANGIGRVYAIRVKGPLPYVLNFSCRVREEHFPNSFAVDVFGDYEGEAAGRLTQEGAQVRAYYTLCVRFRRPLMRSLSFLAKPLLCMNHDWVIWRANHQINRQIQVRRTVKTEQQPMC